MIAPRYSKRQRRIARRNPQEVQDPTVVLVRRFDPTGEDLSAWEPLARDADGSIAFLSPPKAKAAALNPPRDADLHVGDLIVTVPAEALSGIEEHATGLYIVAPDGVKAAPEPPKDLGGPWLATWGQNAYKMLNASVSVDRKRLVMAACDCAETVLHLVPEGEERPRIAVETARAWCFGRASAEAAEAAADAADAASAADAAAYAAYAAASAADAAAYAAAADAYAAASAADAAAYAAAYASGTSMESTYRSLAPLVDRWIPLPVMLLSRLGYPDAIPFDPSTVPVEDASQRENPRRVQRTRRNLPRSHR